MSEHIHKPHQNTNAPAVQTDSESEPINENMFLTPLVGYFGTGTPPQLPPAAQQIIQLQRLIGNRAVQKLLRPHTKVLQRQETGEETEGEIVDITPLADILREMHERGETLLNIVARAIGHHSVRWEDIRPYVEQAGYVQRRGVLDATDLMNSVRLRFSERDFSEFESMLWETNLPDAPAGMPRRMEDTRPLSEILAELRAEPTTTLTVIVRTAIEHGGRLSDIQADIERASSSEREIVRRDHDLMLDAEEHFSAEDFQALQTALQQAPAATSPEVTAALTSLRSQGLSLPQFLRAAFAAGAHVHDVRADIDNASPEARLSVSSDEDYMTYVHSSLGDVEYQEFLIALQVGLSGGGTSSAGITPERTDSIVRSVLGRYLLQAIRDGASIENHVAIVDDADWDRVGREEFAGEWDAERDRIAGFYSRGHNRVWIRRSSASAGTMIHEAVHLYSSPTGLPSYLNEGTTEYFTHMIIEQMRIPALRSGVYEPQVRMIQRIITGLNQAGFDGRDVIAQAYFNGQLNQLHAAFERRYGQNRWQDFLQALGSERDSLHDEAEVEAILSARRPPPTRIPSP